ncbi:MAG: hypothetical protein V3U76_10495 [Granulosicoccus sp.]
MTTKSVSAGMMLVIVTTISGCSDSSNSDTPHEPSEEQTSTNAAAAVNDDSEIGPDAIPVESEDTGDGSVNESNDTDEETVTDPDAGDSSDNETNDSDEEAVTDPDTGNETTSSEGSPLTIENIDSIFRGINQLVNNSAPARLNPVIAQFRNTAAEPVQGLVVGERIADTDNNVNALIDVSCTDGGNYIISEQQQIPEGAAAQGMLASAQRLTFNSCLFLGDTYNGAIQFGIDRLDDDRFAQYIPHVPNGLNYIGYEEFSASLSSGDVIKLNGTSVRTLRGEHIYSSRANGLEDSMQVSYQEHTGEGSIEVTDLMIRNNGFWDHLSTDSIYYNSHNITGSLSAPWTYGRRLKLTTQPDFDDFNSGYTTGALLIQDEDLNTLTIDANTGHPDTFNITLSTAGTGYGAEGIWGDKITFPCLIELSEEAVEGTSLAGCKPPASKAPFVY